MQDQFCRQIHQNSNTDFEKYIKTDEKIINKEEATNRKYLKSGKGYCK